MLTDRTAVMLGVTGTWGAWAAGVGAEASTVLGAWMPVLLGLFTFSAVVVREASAWRRGQIQRYRERALDAEARTARSRAMIRDAAMTVLSVENRLREDGAESHVIAAVKEAREALRPQ